MKISVFFLKNDHYNKNLSKKKVSDDNRQKSFIVAKSKNWLVLLGI